MTKTHSPTSRPPATGRPDAPPSRRGWPRFELLGDLAQVGYARSVILGRVAPPFDSLDEDSVERVAVLGEK